MLSGPIQLICNIKNTQGTADVRACACVCVLVRVYACVRAWVAGWVRVLSVTLDIADHNTTLNADASRHAASVNRALWNAPLRFVAIQAGMSLLLSLRRRAERRITTSSVTWPASDRVCVRRQCVACERIRRRRSLVCCRCWMSTSLVWQLPITWTHAQQFHMEVYRRQLQMVEAFVAGFSYAKRMKCDWNNLDRGIMVCPVVMFSCYCILLPGLWKQLQHERKMTWNRTGI